MGRGPGSPSEAFAGRKHSCLSPIQCAARLRDLTYWGGLPTWPPNMTAAPRCSMTANIWE
jgi:hypothetical protein